MENAIYVHVLLSFDCSVCFCPAVRPRDLPRSYAIFERYSWKPSESFELDGGTLGSFSMLQCLAERA